MACHGLIFCEVFRWPVCGRERFSSGVPPTILVMFGMIFREGQFLFLRGGILIRRFSLFFPLLLLRLRRGALISRYRMANSVAMM